MARTAPHYAPGLRLLRVAKPRRRFLHGRSLYHHRAALFAPGLSLASAPLLADRVPRWYRRGGRRQIAHHPVNPPAGKRRPFVAELPTTALSASLCALERGHRAVVECSPGSRVAQPAASDACSSPVNCCWSVQGHKLSRWACTALELSWSVDV